MFGGKGSPGRAVTKPRAGKIAWSKKCGWDSRLDDCQAAGEDEKLNRRQSRRVLKVSDHAFDATGFDWRNKTIMPVAKPQRVPPAFSG